jgi:hypothetical protein
MRTAWRKEITMRWRRVVGAATLIVALLVLAAPPAFAVLRANVGLTRTPTSHRGATLVSVYAICVDRDTEDPVSAEAEVVVTLTQGNRSVVKAETFTCFGDQPDAVTLSFRGFHPGDAFVEVWLTACDEESCQTAGFSGPFTLVRSQSRREAP